MSLWGLSRDVLVVWQHPVQALEWGRWFFGARDGFACSLLCSFVLDNPVASSGLSEQESIACLMVPIFHQPPRGKHFGKGVEGGAGRLAVLSTAGCAAVLSEGSPAHLAPLISRGGEGAPPATGASPAAGRSSGLAGEVLASFVPMRNSAAGWDVHHLHPPHTPQTLCQGERSP